MSAISLVTFVDNLGAVSGERPSYSATHSYAVMIDVGSTPVHLTLGVGDCGVGDNTGGFTVRLTPVARIR